MTSYKDTQKGIGFILARIGLLCVFFIGLPASAAVLPPGNISSCGELAAPGTYTLTSSIGTPGLTCLTVSSSGVSLTDGGNNRAVAGNISANAVSVNADGFSFTVTGSTTISGDTSIQGNGTGIIGTVTFEGDSYNSGNITGNAIFTERSYNYLIVDNTNYFGKYTFDDSLLVDSSGSGNNLTRFSGTTDPARTTAVKKFGTGAAEYFGTSGRSLETPTIDWGSLTSYTLEGWFYLTADQPAGASYPGTFLWAESTPGDGTVSVARPSATGILEAGHSLPGGGGANITGTTAMTLNAWHHVATSWDGSTFRLFLDGNLEGSTAASTIRDRQQPLTIGALDPSNGGYTLAVTGYIDNFKIALNQGLYTSSFTPAGNTGTISGAVVYNGFSGNNANGYYLLGQKTTLDSSGFGIWNDVFYNAGVPVAGVSVSGNVITVDGVDFPYTYGVSGTVWNFQNGATNSGDVTGSVRVYSPSTRPIAGTINGSITYFNYPGTGSYWYSTNGSADWNDPLNWWLDVDHTEQATYPPDTSTDVVFLGSTAPSVSVNSWVQPNSIDSSGLVDGGGVAFSGTGTVSANITGNATFNTGIIYTGTLSATGYFFSGSTNGGSVSNPVYIPVSSGKIWTNYASDGDWNNSANWLGGIATTSDTVILTASITLPYDVTNDFFVLNNGITIDGGSGNQYSITGDVTSADGTAGQDEDGSWRGVSNGTDGVGITLANTSVSGNIVPGSGGRGGNNYAWWGGGATGGTGGSLTISGVNLDLSDRSISTGAGGAGGDDECGGGCYGNGSAGSNGALTVVNTGTSVMDVSRRANLYLSALSNLTIIDNGDTHDFGSFPGGYVIFPGETVTSASQCESLSIPGTYYVQSFTGDCTINHNGIILDGQDTATITGSVTGAIGASGQDEGNCSYSPSAGSAGVSLSLIDLNVTGNVSAGAGGNGGSSSSSCYRGGNGGTGGSLTISGLNLDLSDKSISAGAGGSGGNDGCNGGCSGYGSAGSNGNVTIDYTGLTTNPSTYVYNAADLIVNSYHNGPWNGVFDPKIYYYSDEQGNGGRSGDWGDALNWYFDSAFSTPAGSVPLGFSNVVISDGHVTRDTSGSAVAGTLTLNGSATIAIPVTLTSGAVFGDSSSNSTTPPTPSTPQITELTITGTYAEMPNSVIRLPQGGSFSSADVYSAYGSWNSTSTGATKFAQYLTATYQGGGSISSAVASGDVVTVTIPYGSPLTGTWSGNAGLAEVSNTSGQDWSAITSSADGMKLAAVSGQENTIGYIYTSDNGGITWTQRTDAGERSWSGISSSADGLKLAATARNEYIYTSDDAGATWTERSGSGIERWSAVSYSRDGSTIVAVTWAWGSGDIYVSRDGGASWDAVGPSSVAWQSVGTNQDGTKIVAGSWDGNGGLTEVGDYANGSWSWNTAKSGGNICGISMSPDGTVLVSDSCSSNGFSISTDAGSSWTDFYGGRSFCQSAVSSDGNTIAATACSGAGSVYVSQDRGSNWSEFSTLPLSNSYIPIAMSSDGSKIYAAQLGGSIWVTSSGGVSLQAIQPAAPASNGLGSVTSNSSVVFNASSINNALMNVVSAIFNASSTNNGIFGPLALPETFNDGLIGWWRLNETDPGTAPGGTDFLDSSGNGNNGVGHGDIAYGANAHLSPSSPPGYVTVPSLSALDNTQHFSVGLWFNMDSLDNQGAFFSKMVGGDYGNDILMAYAGGNLFVQVNNGGDGAGYFPFSQTGWHYLTVAYDGTKTGNDNRLKIYVDGVQQAATYDYSVPDHTANTGYPLNFGCYNADDNGCYHPEWSMRGYMSDVGIWSRSLTGGEIKAIYQNRVAYANNLTFVGDNSNNNGTTTGTVTRLFTTLASTTRNFLTEGNRGDWTVIARGAVVDISNAVYDTTTNVFKALMDPISRFFGSFFTGNNPGGQVVPQISVATSTLAYTGDVSTKTIKWKPLIDWDTSVSCLYSYDAFVTTHAVTCSSSDATLPRPAAGQHTLYLRGTDAKGAVTETGLTFFYDNTVPLSIGPDDETLVLDETTRPYYYLASSVSFPLTFLVDAELRGSATSTASSTGGYTVDNDIDARGNDIAIKNVTVTGTVASSGQGNGAHGGGISIYNSTIGYIVSNGANNPSGRGGNGGRVFVDPSVVIAVTANGGDGTTGGGDGGSVVLESSDLDTITANGGHATSCGNGGDAGEISLLDSSYRTLTNEPGDGTASGCPGQTRSGGTRHSAPVVRFSPRPSATAQTTAAPVRTSAGTSETLREFRKATALSLSTVSLPVNFVGRLPALAPLPTFGGTGKGSFSFESPVAKFLFEPLPAALTNSISSSPRLSAYLASAGVTSARALVRLSVRPLAVGAAQADVPGVYSLSVDGRAVSTQLASDGKESLFQTANVSAGAKFRLSLSPVGAAAVTGRFDGKAFSFDRSGFVDLVAPKVSGTYALTSSGSPLGLTIRVGTVSTESVTSSAGATARPNLWQRVKGFFLGAR